MNLTTIILRDDFRVVVSFDGREGVQKAFEVRPDLILLDIYMPGLSGLDVCRTLRNCPETASTPIVMLTAGASKKDVSDSYSAGANDFVTKPFEPEELIDRIRKLLEGPESKI